MKGCTWPSRWGPTSLLTAVMLLAVVFGVSAQTTLVQIGAGGPTSSGGFENATPTGVPATDFAANNWTVAQSGFGNNRLFVGTAGTPASGAYHAFSGPDNATWLGGATAVWQHIYRDITIPPGESVLTISYRAKISAVDPTWDFTQVRIGPNTSTPSAGSEWTAIGVVLLQQNDMTTSYTNYSVITGVTPGNTYRVCFSYRNDGVTPHGAVAWDDIQIQSSAPITYTATAQGGLWNSPATWVGGVVPPGGNNIVIPAGSTVTVNQVLNYGNLTVNGNLNFTTVTTAAPIHTLSGNLTVGATGNLYWSNQFASLNQINIGGNLTNNGYINAVTGVMTFNGTGNQEINGSGTFEGTGGRGVIRGLLAVNNGTFTLNQTQNITVTQQINNTANNFITNGRLRIDNAVDVFQNSVSQLITTNMGTGYTTAPVVLGQSVSQWTAGGPATANTRYFSGTNVYLCTAGGTFGASPPTNTTPVTETNGSATVLWVGNLGNLGNAFQVTTVTAGTQYYCGDNLYLCTVTGTPSAAAPPTHTSGTAVSGTATFAYVGTVAKASLNWDASTQTVRSLNLVSGGSGYQSIPTIAISNTGAGSGATFSAVMFQSAGPANSLALKATASTFTGSADPRHSNAPAGAAGNGVYSATAASYGWYNSVPEVGFAPPPLANLVTAQGSGYNTGAPTVTVSGGTLISGAAIVSSDFQVNVADGRVISVYYTGATTKIYSVPPTISLTGGSGSGATISWGTAYPTATVNLSNGSSGYITSINITNNGYGYVSAPSVGLRAPVAGEVGASLPSCRLQQLNIQWGFFAPQTTNPNNNSIMQLVPSNGRVNAIAITSGVQTFTSNIEVTASSPLPTFSGVIDMGGSNNLRFSHPDYAGTTGTVSAFVANGSVELSFRGGNTTSATRTFPIGGGTGATAHFVHTTGLGTIATGFTYTGMRVSRFNSPSGTVSPAGNITGVRGVRADLIGTGTLDNLNTGRTMQMFWNILDNLVSDNPSLFLADATAPTGPWTVRSVSTGTGSLPATGSRTTATAAPGPFAVNNTMYFAWVNNGFTPPPGLAYNVVRTTNVPYNSIASVAKGGDGTGVPLTGWVTNIANDEEQATINLPGWGATYQGSPITGVRVHTNGFLQIINGSINFPTNPWNNNMAQTDAPNVVAAFWEDLVNKTTGGNNRDNSIIYSITGVAPNRTLTVEWSNMAVFGAAAAAELYFQIQLLENDGSIRINYGDHQLFNGTVERRYSYSVGIKGGYNSTYPQAGQVFAQQYENYNLFSHIRTQLAHYGANGLAISPEPRSRYTFTPGAYTPPSPPVPTAPANDLATAPELITSLSVFPSNIAWNVPDNKPRIYSSRFATAGGVGDPGPCGGPANQKNVWFRFQANEENVTVRVYPSGGYIARVGVYNDDNTVNLACVVGAQGLQTDVPLTGLTIGNFYNVSVSHDRVGTNAVFTVGTVSNGQATNVSINNGGNGYTIAPPTFAGPGGARMNATGGGGQTFVGAVTTVTSEQVTGGSFDGGNDYTSPPTVTVESPDWGITGDFAIVIYAPPINDDCGGAIQLTNINTTTCTPGTVSGTLASSNQLLNINTASATPSPEIIGGCGTVPDDDLWYRFVATGNRSRVRVQGSAGFDPALQLWQQAGGVCATKTLVVPPAGPPGGCVNSTGVNGLEDVEFATTPGTTYFIRVFHATSGFGGVGATFDICVTTIPDVDIQPVALINPSTTGCGSPTQNVTVRIRNSGALPRLAGETVQYTVNITGPVTVTLNETIALATDLAIGEERNITLAGTFNMTANGTYNFAVTATMASPADQNTANDVLTPAPTRVINVIPAPTALDGLNAQGTWVISQLAGTGNWAFVNTPQNNGGAPVVPFDEGNGYLYFNSYSFSSGTISRATSPCFDLSSTVCSRLTFRFKRDAGFLGFNDRVRVRVSTDGGLTFSAPLSVRNLTVNEVFTEVPRPLTGASPFVWHTMEVNLSAYLGQTIRIAFDAVSEFGNNMMIDDFRILPSVSNDVEALALISPVPNQSCGNTTANVTFRVRNNACFDATNVPYTVNIGGSASPSVLTGTIPLVSAGTELNFNAGNITITGNAPLVFNITVTNPGDEVPGNNSIGPINVPLRQAPTVTASIADPNLVLGFSTTLNASATLNNPTATFTNNTAGAFGPVNITRNIVVSGLGNLAANQVQTLTINLLHTWMADVEITLTDPTGVTRDVIIARGGSGDNMIGTVFGNFPTPIAAGTPPFTGNFAPEQSFTGFSSTPGSANGTWTLSIEDNFPPIDDGTFLNATLAFANAIVQANYTCPTCPTGFPASAVNPNVSIAYPNNPLGGTYPVGVYPIQLVVSDAAGCAVTTNLSLNVFTTNVWLGVSPGADNWQNPANWQSAPAPPISTVAVTIPNGTPFAPNIATSGSVGTLKLFPNASVNIGNGATLNVAADILGNPGSIIEATGNGEVVLNGTGLQTLGNNVNIRNLRLQKTSGSVQVSGGVNLFGVMTIANTTSPITVLPTGKFTFKSNAAGTARLAPVPAGASLIGNFTMERWLGPIVGAWYFIGSPMGGNNFTDWAQDFKVTGPASSITGAHYGGQAGVWNVANVAHATIFTYNEATHNTRFDTVQKIGWKIAPNTTIQPGVGYRVFIKGSTLNKQLFDNTGSVVTGTFNFPQLTRNTYTSCVPAAFPCRFDISIPGVSATSGDFYSGWNLLANPYPSPIDWDATGVGTWTKPSGMQNNAHRWNVSGYGVYVGNSGVWAGTGPAPANPNIIPSSQAFFVRLTSGSSATLSIGENAKATSPGGFLRTAVVQDRISLKMRKQGDDSYDFTSFISFSSNATDGFDAEHDVTNLGSGRFSFGFPADGQVCVYNVAGELNTTKVVPIVTEMAGETGVFSFTLEGLSTFAQGVNVYIKDKVTNTIHPMYEGSAYEFQINANGGVNDFNRFELIFDPQSVVGVRTTLGGSGLVIYPNPTASGTATTFAISGLRGDNAGITVVDMMGREVHRARVALDVNGNAEYVLEKELPAGVYTVRAKSGNDVLVGKVVVK